MILTLAMVMSLCVAPASAADGKVTITITSDKATVDTTTGDAVVTYTVKAKVTDTNLKVGALTIELAPSAGLTLADKTKTSNPSFYYKTEATKYLYNEETNPEGIFTSFSYAKDAKTFVAAGATSTRNLNNSTGEVVLMTIMGKIAKGTTETVTLGTTTCTYGDVKAEASHNCDVTPATVTITSATSNELPVTIAKPTTGGTPQGSITETADYTGSITWAPTIAAGGKFAANTEYTANVTLTAKGEYKFASDVKPTVTDATSVTVENVAPDGKTLTFKAKFSATGSATLTGIKIIDNIDGHAPTVAVPHAAPNTTETNTLTLVATSVYDDGTGGPVAATWEITTVPIPKGVSIDKTTGKLTVTNEASDGTVRVLATFEGKTDPVIVTIKKDTPAASAIVAAPPATTDIAVPNGGTNTSGNCSYKVYDQYGAEMTGISATWKMKLEPATVTGVTLIPANGSISVTNAATTCKATLYAESGALKSNEITFNIIREESKPSVVTITGADSMNVPIVHAPGADGWNHETYTAEVKDQYNNVISNPGVEWSVTGATGVSIDNTTGKLTVSNKAKAGPVTITAKSGDASGNKTVTINKDVAKATLVEICDQAGEGPETSLLIPTGTGTNNVDYTAKVYDQYGVYMPGEMVHWALDPLTVTGVELDDTTVSGSATLKVGNTATSGTTFKLKANTATLGTSGVKELDITLTSKTPASVTTAPEAVANLEYNGNEQALVTEGTASGGTMQYSLGSSPWSTEIPTAKDAGTYSVQYKVVGDATHTDTTPVTLEVTIAPKTLTKADLTPTGSTSKVYDGTTNSSITVGVKASSLCGTDTLAITGSAVYNSANVAEANTITFTPNAITTGNYTLAATEKLTITNASITPTTLTITPNAGQSKEFGATDPTLTYAYSGEVSGETPAFDGELARDPGENVGTYEIKQGTLKLKDNTSFLANNYKLVVASGSKFEITKAASPTLKDITDSQKYTVTSGETAIGTAGMPADAGTLTYAKGTTESTTGTVAIDSWAVDATGKVTYTLSGGAAGDTVTLPVTIGSANYNDATVKVVITLTKPSSSGGGGGGVTTYPITVKSAKNGDVTASHKSATKGATVTLTVNPDKGYVLDTLTVLDGKDKEIKLTEKNGKYTFTMPDSKVTVEAMFKAEQTTGKNPFIDVPAGSYYEDAVIWAVDKGITTGTSATTFNPNGICTRAQAVTFLWRAAGSPAAKSGAMPFADVKAGSYYYDAVLWAVEQGITKGTSDTMFSPDATCTRAQIVTFLWRANGSPAVSGNSAFTDVAADAYYAAAVTWAEKNDVTGGIGGGLFGSNNNCTRAQIVTFIYRSVK